MPKRYFGTDGIRGRAGDTLTPELAMRAAFGFAQTIADGRIDLSRRRPVVVLGRDCRLSSPMLAAAVQSGINLGGCDVLEIGIAPTPVVTQTLLKHQAAGGVMITASHNPVPDNGIKMFGADGFKLADTVELSIEAAIDNPRLAELKTRINFGTAVSMDPSAGYLAALQRAVKPSTAGKSLTIVLDCAHGATCQLAPQAFAAVGYQVKMIHGEFNGERINVGCGATDLRDLKQAVLKHNADLGLAFDGDGDRVLAVDQAGNAVSGDKIIALFASHLRRYKKQGAVVMTQMTNLGVEEALNQQGVRMIRTDVGDIQVRQEMQCRSLNLGGEQSGHIIMLDRSKAGDGILAGLQLAALLQSARQPLSELAQAYPEYPQRLVNLTVHDKSACQSDKVLQRRIGAVQTRYKDVRFYVRPSGTENLLRVLTEARNPERCNEANAEVCELIAEWDRINK